jgi:hypothetical protein
MISVKIYRAGKEVVVAACDAELLGKKFRSGRLKIEVNDFYRGELVSESHFEKMLSDMTIGNFVGERTIGICTAMDLVDKRNVLTIGKVKHAQYVST